MVNYVATPLQNQTPWSPGRTYVLGYYFELTAGLGLGDTITFPDAVTPSGIIGLDAVVRCSQLDSNATPLGRFELGDSTANDANAAARWITGGVMGTNVAGAIVVSFSNVPPAFATVTPPYPPNAQSYVVQTKGAGYEYYNDENSPTNEPGGFLDLVLTVTTAPATAAATGTVWMYFTHYCVGNP